MQLGLKSEERKEDVNERQCSMSSSMRVLAGDSFTVENKSLKSTRRFLCLDVPAI